MSETPLIDELIPLGAAGLELLNACRRVADQADRELLILEKRARREALEQRVAAFLAGHPSASANETWREVGGNKADVLDAVRAVRNGRTTPARAIMRELGVSRAQADRVIRWCHEHGAGAIRPVDGARKLYVERSSVERWLELSRTAA